MRFPQIPDHLRAAPAQVLRTMFAGIGQVLLVADRVRNRAAEQWRAQSAGDTGGTASAAAAGHPGEPAPGRLAGAGPPPAPPPAAGPAPAAAPYQTADAPLRRWRSLDETGNVRLIKPGPAGAHATAEGPQPVAPSAAARRPPAEAASAPAEPPLPNDAEPPLANYDALSLPSLRARLRTLDTGQLRALLAYERAHAGRPAVLSLFERRIAKLEGEQG
jgi:hypothetical protein